MKIGDKIFFNKNYSEDIWIQKNNILYNTSKKIKIKKYKSYTIKNIYSVFHINDMIQLNNGIEILIEDFKYYIMTIKQLRMRKLKKIKTLWNL